MAIPSRVVALHGDMASVEAFGQQRQVSLLLMPHPVAPGDYLLIQAGGLAYERVEPERALETLALLTTIVEQAPA